MRRVSTLRQFKFAICFRTKKDIYTFSYLFGASKTAYSIVAYIRFLLQPGNRYCILLRRKTHLGPFKVIFLLGANPNSVTEENI